MPSLVWWGGLAAIPAGQGAEGGVGGSPRALGKVPSGKGAGAGQRTAPLWDWPAPSVSCPPPAGHEAPRPEPLDLGLGTAPALRCQHDPMATGLLKSDFMGLRM